MTLSLHVYMKTCKHVRFDIQIYRCRHIQEENEIQCKYVYNITCTHIYIINGNSVLEDVYQEDIAPAKKNKEQAANKRYQR